MATPTNKDIVKYFQKAVKEGWGYVWGFNGALYTKEIAEKYKAEKRSTSASRNPATYWTIDCKKWFGKMVADCSGGIVGAIRSINPSFGDRSANTFKSQFTESGKVNTIPEIAGLAVWRKGHIGIYEGNGYVLEFRGTAYGAVRTKLKDRDFTHWGKIKGVEYEVAEKWVVTRVLKRKFPMMKGNDVEELQERLYAKGFNCGEVDGKFGKNTEKAVKAFQKARKLTVDGKAGKNTITALGGVWRG